MKSTFIVSNDFGDNYIVGEKSPTINFLKFNSSIYLVMSIVLSEH